MTSSQSLLIFFGQLLYLWSWSRSETIPECYEADMSALLQFKHGFTVARGSASTDPLAYPKTESWELDSTKNGSSSNCCSWDGVECDNNTGHVVALDLSSSCLCGFINSSSGLFQLVHLQRLNLADNHFNYSQIPPGFGFLSGLTHLNLSNSVFSGQIPAEISTLSELVSLDLGCNRDPRICAGLLKLQNPGLTDLVQSLTNLQLLTLDNVDISSEVPASAANLSSLTSLSMELCGLYGIFPASVFQLPKLEHISLASNGKLTGHLPEFNSTSPLQVLQLSTTSFSGILPYSLGNLQSLKFLNTEGCNFTGSFPSSFGNLTKLTHLSVRGNPFTAQSIDSLSWLWKLSKLETLYIGKTNLQGKIPPSIGNLSRLVTLGLAGNELKGEIPPQLANLPRLFQLNLWRNQLSGQITSCLTNMTQISSLDLASNYFEGPIPSSVSRLQNLQILTLYGNQLSGTVELDAFLRMKNLQLLQLSWNKLSCLVETEGNATLLPQLHVLGLGSCNLSEFPRFLKDQQQMIRLDLSGNNISGEIPYWFSNISVDSLQFLNLSRNGLTRFCRNMTALAWKNLDTLDLSSNLLQGSIPIPPAPIRFFLISKNALTGNFPGSLCSLSSLVTLDLSFNFLSGMLPSCLGNVNSPLSVLNLRSNRFQGRVPEIQLSGTPLRMIDFSQNEFEGKLPTSLASYSMLEFIDFGDNQLNDTFPSWLGSLPQLQVLILRSNRFHGAIGKPSPSSSFQSLRIIDLSGNSFTGDLPREYFQSWKSMQTVDNSTGEVSYMKQCLSQQCLPPDSFMYTSYSQYDYSMIMINKGIETSYYKISDVFTVIDLSSNKFEGEIPDVVGNLKALHLLNLSNNFLTGHIPSSMGNLGAMESLDLSQNRLSGEIPQELSRLTFLAVMNLSFNNLSGPIPRGSQFDTFTRSSFGGNPGLCGDAVSKKCETPGMDPALEGEEDSDSWMDFDWKTVLMGWGSGLVIGVAVGYAFISDKRRWFAEFAKKVYKCIYRRPQGSESDWEFEDVEAITEEEQHRLDMEAEDTYLFISNKRRT